MPHQLEMIENGSIFKHSLTEEAVAISGKCHMMVKRRFDGSLSITHELYVFKRSQDPPMHALVERYSIGLSNTTHNFSDFGHVLMMKHEGDCNVNYNQDENGVRVLYKASFRRSRQELCINLKCQVAKLDHSSSQSEPSGSEEDGEELHPKRRKRTPRKRELDFDQTYFINF